MLLSVAWNNKPPRDNAQTGQKKEKKEKKD
jgi:hypothetical protein